MVFRHKEGAVRSSFVRIIPHVRTMREKIELYNTCTQPAVPLPSFSEGFMIPRGYWWLTQSTWVDESRQQYSLRRRRREEWPTDQMITMTSLWRSSKTIKITRRVVVVQQEEEEDTSISSSYISSRGRPGAGRVQSSPDQPTTVSSRSILM